MSSVVRGQSAASLLANRILSNEFPFIATSVVYLGSLLVTCNGWLGKPYRYGT